MSRHVILKGPACTVHIVLLFVTLSLIWHTAVDQSLNSLGAVSTILSFSPSVRKSLLDTSSLQFSRTISLLYTHGDFHGKYCRIRRSRQAGSVAWLVRATGARGFSCGSWAQPPVSGRDATAPPWWPWSGRQRSGWEEMYPGEAGLTGSPPPGRRGGQGVPKAPWCHFWASGRQRRTCSQDSPGTEGRKDGQREGGRQRGGGGRQRGGRGTHLRRK